MYSVETEEETSEWNPEITSETRSRLIGTDRAVINIGARNIGIRFYCKMLFGYKGLRNTSDNNVTSFRKG